MGRLIIPNRKYLYRATGTGLSPNINNLRFYDSGLTEGGQPVYYDENNIYWLRYSADAFAWTITLIGTSGESGVFIKFASDGNPNGSYFGFTGYSGTVTISEYKNNISIKKQNLGGGKLTAKLIQSAPPFNPASIAGLQAFWNMEGVPPNNQTDNSGNGRTLVYAVELVDATSVAGKIGNAVSFNATDLPFDMGEGARYYTNSWGVDVENDFSMSVWMKTRNFSSYSHIIGAPFQNGFYIGANETELTFNLFNGTVFGITAPTVAANTWVHYVFIRSGNNLILYANNTLVGSVDITGESFPNASVFSVGGGEFNEYYYDGDIDALGIWNAALTPTDIANLWNAGAGVQIS
jgi:hypothetical protein